VHRNFLGGTLFRGEERLTGGRIGEQSALKLAEQVRGAGLPMARLKTGTPPRLDGRTINWAVLDEQPSDGESWTMSAMTARRHVPQLFCAITRTNSQTHDIIRGGLDRSPLFGGAIQGQGPRYCPVDRGQDLPLWRSRRPSGFPRTRGPRHPSHIPQRNFDFAAHRCPAGYGTFDGRGWRPSKWSCPAMP
jgi:hypothetical protein